MFWSYEILCMIIVSNIDLFIYWYRNLMQYIEAITWKVFIELIDF